VTDAIERVKKIFSLIENASTIDELIGIQNQFTQKEIKDYFPSDKYPQLEFSLSPEEVNQLKKEKVLDSDGTISKCCAKNNVLRTPLEKLLYSIIWKNGDLGKEKHITDGVLATRENKEIKNEKGLVFYQFGKHLEDKNNPIIDQHVVRAFSVYEACQSDIEQINNILKKETINAKDKDVFSRYFKWQSKHKLKASDPIEFTYYLDRLLFGLGKSIKIKASRNVVHTG
jgi:hypothetical protein